MYVTHQSNVKTNKRCLICIVTYNWQNFFLPTCCREHICYKLVNTDQKGDMYLNHPPRITKKNYSPTVTQASPRRECQQQVYCSGKTLTRTGKQTRDVQLNTRLRSRAYNKHQVTTDGLNDRLSITTS